MGIVELRLLLSFLQALSQQQATPPQPGVIEAPASIAEIGELVMHCYHPSGRFRDVNVVQHPWARGRDYNASDSAVISIDWNGAFLQTRYRLIVALISRASSLKAVILSDNDKIPPNAACALNRWVQVTTTSVEQ